ncbi:MAG TPA: DUF2510 domain-containing protein [Acidimicrobiales bacterium]|nr:DUF2510 domain-containing protein [Acidimicrobiales bacterium]
MTTVDRTPGPSLRVALGVLAVGLVLAVPATAVMVSRVVGTYTAPSMTTPTVARRHLSMGTWVIFERTGTRSGFGGVTVSRDNSVALRPSDVTVAGPDGNDLQVAFAADSETITRGSAIYSGALAFSVDTPGDYTVTVTRPGLQVIVARSIREQLHGFLGLFAVAALGGLLVLTGLVLVVVGAVRRGRAPSRPGPWGGTPAGWYPDPSGQARVRWWDGARWTEHSSA